MRLLLDEQLDQRLRYDFNEVIIVSAKTNRYVDVVPLMPNIHAALQEIQQGMLIHVGP